MNKKITEQLKEHDRQDKAVSIFNWREMLGREFESFLRAADDESDNWRQIIESDLEEAQEVLALLEKAGRAEGLPEFEAGFELPVLTRKTDKFNIRKHTAGVAKYFHKHSFYEMIYVYEGECVQYFYGREDAAVLPKKQACILSPEAVHAMEPAKEKDIVLKLTIPRGQFEKIAAGTADAGFDLLKEIGNNKGVYVLQASPRADSLILGLLDEAFMKREFSGSAVDSFLTLLIIELIRKPVKSADSELMDKVTSYIGKNLRTASLRGFAESCGYSASHLGRTLRSGLNTSFSEVLTRARMEESSKLLANTDLSVENIAYSLGYKNASGFYKQFSMVYGVSPNKYRVLMR